MTVQAWLAIAAGLGFGAAIGLALYVRGVLVLNSVLLEEQSRLLDRIQASSLAEVHAFDPAPDREPREIKRRTDSTGLIRDYIPDASGE